MIMITGNDEKNSTQTLQIYGVSRDLLKRIEERGAKMRIPVKRNPLILWVLSEYAEGRLVPDDASADADLAHRVVVPAPDGDQGERRAA